MVFRLLPFRLKNKIKKSGKKRGFAYVYIETDLKGKVVPSNKIGKFGIWKTKIKMNGYDEHEGKVGIGESGDSIRDIIEEYKAAYNALSPDAKWEADVRRALALINLCVDQESLSDELQLRFAGWFMEHAECDYVEEAFCRYLDQRSESRDRMSESEARKMLDVFWVQVN